MQELAREMIDNLERTAGLYEEILATERDKQRAVAESRLDALPGILAREEQLVGRAAQLEAARLVLRHDLARADARLGPSPRLSHVIAVLDGPERDLLAQKHAQLAGLARQIHEANRANVRLLRGSPELLQEMCENMASAPAPPEIPDPRDGLGPSARDPACLDPSL
jgi:hypothetical protein